MVSVNYSLSREDYINYYTYVLWDAPERKRKRLVSYLKQSVPLAFFTLVLYYTGILERSSTFTLVIIGLIILTSLLSLTGIRSNTVKQAQKIADDPRNSSIFVDTTMSVSDSGLQLKDALAEVKFQWKAINRKLENDKYYFLFINSIQAIIIPKRVFTVDEKKDFEKLLSQHLSIDAEIGHLVKS